MDLFVGPALSSRGNRNRPKQPVRGGSKKRGGGVYHKETAWLGGKIFVT